MHHGVMKVDPSEQIRDALSHLTPRKDGIGQNDCTRCSKSNQHQTDGMGKFQIAMIEKPKQRGEADKNCGDIKYGHLENMARFNLEVKTP